MPGLGPGIHVFAPLRRGKTWMGRDKPGHDREGIARPQTMDPSFGGHA